MKSIVKKKKDAIEKALSFKNRNDEIKMLSEMVNSDFLDTIKHSLQIRGINSATLAHDIKVSPSYVSQIFNGNRMLNITFITKLRRQYAIPLELVDTSNYVTYVIIVPSRLNELENYRSYISAKPTIDIQYQEVTTPQSIN